MARFDARGSRLWRSLHAGGAKHDPATDVLIEEACRIADRLDKLHRILIGRDEEWMRVRAAEVGSEGDLVVTIDGVLTEARQQATALRGLLAPLLKATPVAAPVAKVDGKADEVKRRREIRRAKAAGL